MNSDEINCADASWDGWHMSNVVEYADYANAFVDGAEWFAAGMAVCAFLQDLAAMLDMESPAPQFCQCCGQSMLCTSCGVG